MSRNTRDKNIRVRFRTVLGARTQLVTDVSPGRIKKGFGNKKVLCVYKVSNQQLEKTGEFNPLPEKLMKEFRGGATQILLPDPEG